MKDRYLTNTVMAVRSRPSRGNGKRGYMKNVHDENKLIDALRPFAALLQPHHESLSNDRIIFAINGAQITAGDLRRAAQYVQEYDNPAA